MSRLTQPIHLCFGLPRFLLPGGNISRVFLPMYYWSRLFTSPHHVSLAFLYLSVIFSTFSLFLMSSFCTWSLSVWPHANLHIFISVTSSFFMWEVELVIDTVSIPYIPLSDGYRCVAKHSHKHHCHVKLHSPLYPLVKVGFLYIHTVRCQMCASKLPVPTSIAQRHILPLSFPFFRSEAGHLNNEQFLWSQVIFVYQKRLSVEHSNFPSCPPS